MTGLRWLYLEWRRTRRMPRRVRVAMAAYWLSGQMARIRYPQRTYVLDFNFEDQDVGEFKTTKGPRQMLPAPWSTRLMSWAMSYDWEHSDHWALDHRVCKDAYGCEVCGGLVHPDWAGPGMGAPEDGDDSIHAVSS